VKRSLFIACSGVLGFGVGILVFLLAGAFSERCGEPCSADRFSLLLLCMAAGATVFSVAGHWVSRGPMSRRRTATACAVASALMLLPACTYYVYSLRAEYQRLEALAPVRVTTDFHHMAIATREVQAGLIEGQASPVVVVPRWERCLIGLVRCDSSPKQAEMLCKAGTVRVNEADWAAFALIPEENAMGVSPLKSMRLCASE
jgi:hypothetical protein